MSGSFFISVAMSDLKTFAMIVLLLFSQNVNKDEGRKSKQIVLFRGNR